MKPVLILQHQTAEHPAYLQTWLEQQSIDYKIVNAGAGEEFPASIEPYAALAVLGGGMSSNDPLLSNRQAEILILQAMRLDLPVIGHCLGGQLMTRALGGTVCASPQPEIGWQPIEYVDTAQTREWFGSTPTDTVIHWHYEAFSLPAGAVRLATSAACENQAWAMGNCLAMQFHIEIDATKTQQWAADVDPKWTAAQQTYNTVQNSEAIVAGIDRYLLDHQATAAAIYRRWLRTTSWATN